MKNFSVNDVRAAIRREIGRRVVVRANVGRRKYEVSEGIIKEAYPYVFMIEIDHNQDEACKTVSYTYSDILTKDVKLSRCAE